MQSQDTHQSCPLNAHQNNEKRLEQDFVLERNNGEKFEVNRITNYQENSINALTFQMSR